MRNKVFFLLFALAMISSCGQKGSGREPSGDGENSPQAPDASYVKVSLKSAVSDVQPMTGLVLWPRNAKSRNQTYGDAISLEYSYCLPCRVVTGKKDGMVQYDWSWFEEILNDVESRNHQAIVRFRYEYPGSTDVDGKPGTTAVPQYIKDLPDYNETCNEKQEDGITWYADWSNTELQWFTMQFYSDFAARYGTDPRIAFVEVGFGHWSEYHIYGTPLKLGENFPSHSYQSDFLNHVASVLPIPWLVSIDASDASYSPIVRNAELMSLGFGLFDDSFMHSGHEGGYNENCWNSIGRGIRWQIAPCGGEISYYTSTDQKNFLNPKGMYGVTWEDASSKYHISFMLADGAPGSAYGTPERFKEAGLASGYRFKLTGLFTNSTKTVAYITNTGVAPIYRDAFLAVGEVRGVPGLKGLLPGDTLQVYIDAPYQDASLSIVSDYILPTQKIQFESDL